MPPIRPRPRGEIGGRLGGDWVEIGWRLGGDWVEIGGRSIRGHPCPCASAFLVATHSDVNPRHSKKKSKNISINLYIIWINLSYLAVF